MSIKRTDEHRTKTRRARDLRVEALEPRALLTASAETFNPPSLTTLIQQALAEHHRQNTAPAVIDTMLESLQTQLTSGPLADLIAGTVNSTDFVTEVQNLETSFEANVDLQLSPRFPNVDKLLKLQGQRIVAEVSSLNQQNSVGLITNANLPADAAFAINSLSAGPIFALNTPLSAGVTTTTNFETNLKTLVSALSTGATPSLTLAQVNTTLQAEADAYQAASDSALLVTHPNIAAIVDSAVTTLETASTTIANAGGTNAQSQTQLTAAIQAFDAAILDDTGLFGPNGIIAQSSKHNQDSD
jgi:hypothetical protein